ncbi:hypothetical protein ElyMa_003767000 [Elysia marginata]|uniref:Uncharacterized protein n=1 Tax=Elysia marginata TaxID=1093978 RepID=A0AAV4FBT3_9GAST|nr:hypothetical protein ElyMa_003767000 [Elysia marginata]
MMKAFGPSVVKVAPLKSASGEIIENRSKQMERWAENYLELLSRENVFSDKAIKYTTPLPTMEELDAPPTINELPRSSTRSPAVKLHVAMGSQQIL